jgi:small GTP-binding protein
VKGFQKVLYSAMPTTTAKIIIIGNSGVGKTALMRRLVEDTFTESSQTTIGVEYDQKIIPVGDQLLKLQIWDTAGQERFKSIARAYYRNASGVILVFDLANHKSFEDLGEWLNDVQVLCPPNVVVQLVGNKSDLSAARCVSASDAQTFATRHGVSFYLETSAKGGDNVSEAFLRLGTALVTKGLTKPPEAEIQVQPAGYPCC